MPRPVMQGSSPQIECELKFLPYLQACETLRTIPETETIQAIKCYQLVQSTFKSFKAHIDALPASEEVIHAHYQQKINSHSEIETLFRRKYPHVFHPASEQLKTLYPQYKRTVEGLLNSSLLQKAASTLTTENVLSSTEAYAQTLSTYAKVEKIYAKIQQLLEQISSSQMREIFEKTHARIKAYPITEGMNLTELFELKHFLIQIERLSTHRNQILLNQIAHSKKSTTFDPQKEAKALSRYQLGDSECKNKILQKLHKQIRTSLEFNKQLKTTLKGVKQLQSSFVKAAPYLSEAPYMEKLIGHCLLGILSAIDAIETPVDTAHFILTLNPTETVFIKQPEISSPKTWSPKDYSTRFLNELTSQYPVYRSISKGPQCIYTAFICAYLSDPERINAMIRLLGDWNAPYAVSQKPVLELLNQLKENPSLLYKLLRNKKNIYPLTHYLRHLAAHEISFNPKKYPEFSEIQTFPGKKHASIATKKVLSEEKKQFLKAVRHMKNDADSIVLKALSNKLSFSFRVANFDNETTKHYGAELIPAACLGWKRGKSLILLPSPCKV